MDQRSIYIKVLEECLTQLDKLPNQRPTSPLDPETHDPVEFYFYLTRSRMATLIENRIAEAKKLRPNGLIPVLKEDFAMHVLARLDRLEAYVGLHGLPPGPD